MGLMHILTISICVLSIQFPKTTSSTLDTYIVHVQLSESQATQSISTSSSVSDINLDDLHQWYRTFLPTKTTATTSSSIDTEAPRIVYAYRNVFHGFAARLSKQDVKAMEKKPGFISARPQRMIPLHTTHSPSFLGLNKNMGFWQRSNYGRGVIIGVLDTGIVPDHPSFSGAGMPPPPLKWKGSCEFPVVCNNKLIGAKSFLDDNGSPLDYEGHGTHTASTAAGNYVSGANFFGNANGTASGIAPLAHVAMYKVCGSLACSESAIVAAMDAAIDDGIDILSFSIGTRSAPFYADNVAIGTFRAMQRGIFVSSSAGNFGPSIGTMSNEAPWILTVGATTTDRKFRSTVRLGNNQTLLGESLYQPKGFSNAHFPLYFPDLDRTDPNANRFCDSPIANVSRVRGSIVVCVFGEISTADKEEFVKSGGGVGMIIVNTEKMAYGIFASAVTLPTSHVSYSDALILTKYMSSSFPTASISFQGTVIGDSEAPEIAIFSSRGPSRASPGILKPDIVGPGVNILAAGKTKSTFDVQSGTSMACPHLSGVAALLKSAHPKWSPAAIKSAIMTSADTLNLAKKAIRDHRKAGANIFDMGSGQVNPSRANNPGLVYDIQPHDYIPYLCGLGYSNNEVGVILGRRVTCFDEKYIAESQLNYPSFSIVFGHRVQKYTRKVTNVGEAASVYSVKVVQPYGVKVSVSPSALRFSKVNQKLTYQVTFTKVISPSGYSASQGSLSWISPNHTVRSPIAAIFM